MQQCGSWCVLGWFGSIVGGSGPACAHPRAAGSPGGLAWCDAPATKADTAAQGTISRSGARHRHVLCGAQRAVARSRPVSRRPQPSDESGDRFSYRNVTKQCSLKGRDLTKRSSSVTGALRMASACHGAWVDLMSCRGILQMQHSVQATR